MCQELRSKAHKADAAFSQERSVLVKKVIELQVPAFFFFLPCILPPVLTLLQGYPEKVRLLQVRAVFRLRRCSAAFLWAGG